MKKFETRDRVPKAPNNGGRGSSQEAAQRINMIIQTLEQGEKEMNTMIITGGALSASLVWGIMSHLQHLQQAAQVTAQFASVSWTYSPSSRVAVPPVPHVPDLGLAPSGSSLLWGVVYWSTSLFFSLCAIFVAVLLKIVIRDYRVELRRRGRSSTKAQMQEPSDAEEVAWHIHIAADIMYRLYQASLVVLLLGIVNFCLFPVGVTIFALSVTSGVVYVLSGLRLRAIGP